MIDDEDEIAGITRPAWRRVIRCPTVRRDRALSGRRATTRHWVRLWNRAAIAPGLRPC